MWVSDSVFNCFLLMLVPCSTGALSKTARQASRLRSLTPSSWTLQLQPRQQ